MAFNRPSDPEHRSVANFLHYKRPIHSKQRVYITHEEDLVTLRAGREHAWLDQGLEYLFRKLHKPFPFINVSVTVLVYSDWLTTGHLAISLQQGRRKSSSSIFNKTDKSDYIAKEC